MGRPVQSLLSSHEPAQGTAGQHTYTTMKLAMREVGHSTWLMAHSPSHPPAVLGNERAPLPHLSTSSDPITSILSDFSTFVAQSSILFKASSHSQRERESLTRALLARCHLVSDRGQGLRVSSNLHAPEQLKARHHARICESANRHRKRQKGTAVFFILDFRLALFCFVDLLSLF